MPTILSKSTVYLGKNLFGTASKVTAPEVDMETAEIKNAYGAYNLPVGVKAMTCSITIVGFDKDVFNKISNPFSEIDFTIYGSLDKFTNESLSSSEQAKLVIRGSSQKFSLLGELEQQKNIDYSVDFSVSAAKLYIAGDEKYAIDPANNIWRVAGVDMLTTLKKNLAIS